MDSTADNSECSCPGYCISLDNEFPSCPPTAHRIRRRLLNFWWREDTVRHPKLWLFRWNVVIKYLSSIAALNCGITSASVIKTRKINEWQIGKSSKLLRFIDWLIVVPANWTSVWMSVVWTFFISATTSEQLLAWFIHSLIASRPTLKADGQ